jgi:hypothetical protein
VCQTRSFICNPDDRVAVVERRVGVREVGPLVGAATLLAAQRAGGDQARERVRVVEQPLEASEYLLKPVGLDHLISVVSDYCEPKIW